MLLLCIAIGATITSAALFGVVESIRRSRRRWYRHGQYQDRLASMRPGARP